MHASRVELAGSEESGTLDASITPDGRVVAYTDLGPSSSPLVLYCHGAPSSRLDLLLFQDALTALDVRVVSFDPRAIVAPVWVFHGDADTLVPVAHAHHTAELIPGARLVTRPDQGHISILTEIPQLAADLVAPLR